MVPVCYLIVGALTGFYENDTSGINFLIGMALFLPLMLLMIVLGNMCFRAIHSRKDTYSSGSDDDDHYPIYDYDYNEYEADDTGDNAEGD